MHRVTPNTCLSIRIDSEYGCKIGVKQITLLEAIQRQGSITGAAKFLGLSYCGAWRLIDAINKALHEPAVRALSGGHKGGGAALTPVGTQLIELYRTIESHAQAAALPEREAFHKLMREISTE
jgi:molybdate transport system regulatory protein